jgi:hypothetical protein
VVQPGPDRDGRGPAIAVAGAARPAGWADWVNEPLTDATGTAFRTGVVRGRPYGSADWTRSMAEQLGLSFTLRGRERPQKKDK